MNCPTDRAVFLNEEPGPRGSCALVGFADSARVENACGADHFIARNMSMAVEQEPGRADVARRDMNECESVAFAGECEEWREVEPVVIVAGDRENRRADGSDSGQGVVIAKIAEVPNFGCGGKRHAESGREFPVGVGDDGDKHPRICLGCGA